MPRADELEACDRIRHPETEDIVTVQRIRNMLSKTRVYWRHFGASGWFECSPHKELEDCS